MKSAALALILAASALGQNLPDAPTPKPQPTQPKPQTIRVRSFVMHHKNVETIAAAAAVSAIVYFATRGHHTNVIKLPGVQCPSDACIRRPQ